MGAKINRGSGEIVPITEATLKNDRCGVSCMSIISILSSILAIFLYLSSANTFIVILFFPAYYIAFSIMSLCICCQTI